MLCKPFGFYRWFLKFLVAGSPLSAPSHDRLLIWLWLCHCRFVDVNVVVIGLSLVGAPLAKNVRDNQNRAREGARGECNKIRRNFSKPLPVGSIFGRLEIN